MKNGQKFQRQCKTQAGGPEEGDSTNSTHKSWTPMNSTSLNSNELNIPRRRTFNPIPWPCRCVAGKNFIWLTKQEMQRRCGLPCGRMLTLRRSLKCGTCLWQRLQKRPPMRSPRRLRLFLPRPPHHSKNCRRSRTGCGSQDLPSLLMLLACCKHEGVGYWNENLKMHKHQIRNTVKDQNNRNSSK